MSKPQKVLRHNVLTALGALCLDEDVREHRQRGFRRDARGNRGKTFLQFFTGDRKPHHRSSRVQDFVGILVLF